MYKKKRDFCTVLSCGGVGCWMWSEREQKYRGTDSNGQQAGYNN